MCTECSIEHCSQCQNSSVYRSCESCNAIKDHGQRQACEMCVNGDMEASGDGDGIQDWRCEVCKNTPPRKTEKHAFVSVMVSLDNLLMK